MFDVICVGEMVIDFLPGEQPGHYLRNAGGAPANVAIAIARNDLRSGFIGKMGNDDFGRFLVDTLIENKVAYLGGELTDDAVTTMAFVSLDAHGDRSFTFARKPGADMLLHPADIDEQIIRNCKIVHAGSCSLSASPADAATSQAMKYGKSQGKLISFDVNYRNLLWSNQTEKAVQKIREVLPLVNLLKISEEETELFGGEEQIPDLMKENGITLLIMTRGPRGAKAYWQEEIIDVPGLPGGAVDATGAGDAFWGAFLSTLLNQDVTQPSELTREKILKAMNYGNVAGTLCVRKKGAISSLPTRTEIADYLQCEGEK